MRRTAGKEEEAAAAGLRRGRRRRVWPRASLAAAAAWVSDRPAKFNLRHALLVHLLLRLATLRVWACTAHATVV